MDKKMTFSEKQNVASRCKEYREPEVTWGRMGNGGKGRSGGVENVVVTYYAYDPERGELRRKRMRLNRELERIEGKRARREYVRGVVERLRDELKAGWNPWMQQEDSMVYTRWDVVCERYKAYLAKLLSEGHMRDDTVTGYLSRLRQLMLWVAKERKNVRYAYQFDRRLVDAFLDYAYLDKDNTIQTRNNYLAWVKTFAKWLLQKSYIDQDPTAGLQMLRVKAGKKNRSVIPDAVLGDIRQWLETHDKYYLLACYVLHYMFVRPKEMSFLRVADFSVKRKTLTLYGDYTKNGEDAVVTVPDHVMKLMIELKVLEKPGDWYVFSDKCRPGRDHRDDKQFRDFWNNHLRKALKLPRQYKFYSLKDTGITNMLRANTDVLSVRDQARHSSILITDIYTPKDIQAANELLVRYKGVL